MPEVPSTLARETVWEKWERDYSKAERIGDMETMASIRLKAFQTWERQRDRIPAELNPIRYEEDNGLVILYSADSDEGDVTTDTFGSWLGQMSEWSMKARKGEEGFRR